MPVYLCQAGAGTSEPWRHGIQVYRMPFPIDEKSLSSGGNNSSTEQSNAGGVSSLLTSAMSTSGQRVIDSTESTGAVTGNNRHHPATHRGAENQPIDTPRKVRHAEVVLVDDVCVAFGRYWVRLRWPGRKGGFAGYIDLGNVGQNTEGTADTGGNSEDPPGSTSGSHPDGSYQGSDSPAGDDDRLSNEETDMDDPTRDDEPPDNASTRSSEPFEATQTLNCLRTGLMFPSSSAMKLMAVYDDGLSPTVMSAPLPSEPVFCRICREGLHDDADDEQPSPAMENEGDDNARRGQSSSPSGSSMNLGGDGQLDQGNSDAFDEREPVASEPSTLPLCKGPVLPHPEYHPNTPATDNPMLAPCECSGSMAFVHYLCVEQWRCRSRHPEARQGLQCETCNKPYALPPPTRIDNVPQVDNEEWLDAMPPHVMAALRQPHIWWQIGAAIVRRRWLRPLAPVLMSPTVALYCRARRLLKKKGVARRRWACSLCRRRARWKCVRCLRSYYCSRQCQNVSWHIVHKHVCYKPSRLAWSTVVYGLAALLVFPGILRDPLMYDLGFALIPVCFYAMAVLGGGIATILKKAAGLDLRGRMFEVVVIFSTMWLVMVCWGLIGAFFGETSQCHGVMGSYELTEDSGLSVLLSFLRTVVLKHAESWFLMWDRLASNSGTWIRKALCIQDGEGCFEHLHKANADFIFEAHGGAKCASDLNMVCWLFILSAFVSTGNHFWKQRERQLRAARRLGREAHAHQE